MSHFVSPELPGKDKFYFYYGWKGSKGFNLSIGFIKYDSQNLLIITYHIYNPIKNP